MNNWAKAASLGAVTGIRSTAGLKSAAEAYAPGRFAPWIGRLVWIEAAGDKFPWTPARTQGASLLARAVLGGFAASAVCAENDGEEARTSEPWLLGLVGAASAIAATFAACRARQALGRRSRLASAGMGFAEDYVVSAVTRRFAAA